MTRIFGIVIISALVSSSPAYAGKKSVRSLNGLDLSGAILPFDSLVCPHGSVEYKEMRGRVVLGTNPDSTNNLATVPHGKEGGAETTLITTTNLPPHAHKYYDIYASGNSGNSATTPVYTREVGTALFSRTDFNGRTMERFTELEGTGKPLDVHPPYKAFLYCKIQ